jgi:FHA domain-containing protein
LAAVVEGPPSLSERLADRLRTSGCAIGPIETKVAYVRRRGTSWTHPDFHVEFDRTDALRPSSSVSATSLVVARLRIAVIKGVAAQRSYVFTGGRIDIGRRSDVLDQRQRLIRTNHIAFAEDGPDENRTVSRRHAHIELVEHDCYRLWDDRSVHGTLIVRRGRAIRVPAGSRGMKLESDDEIVLGQARLRVAVEKGKREKGKGKREKGKGKAKRRKLHRSFCLLPFTFFLFPFSFFLYFVRPQRPPCPWRP